MSASPDIHEHDPAPEVLTRITLRPIANPLPLGFLALAGGTLLLSGLQLGWVEPTESHTLGLIVIAFVVPLQFLTATFGFLARDVVAGTGMAILSGTWLSIGLVTLTGAPGSTSDALGLLLILAAVAMLVPSAAASGKLVAAAVLATTALRFAVTGLYQLTRSGSWKTTAGIVGLALCALAVYTALAMALEESNRRTILPLRRRNTGAAAVTADLGRQVRDIEHEAGVRAQL
ncbi:MAG TPA: GPR1/FUN34/YaaH family transporter [Gaiellales bacterium]|nr:GPR1/FUN34/YaaH family transporter [Gaiellales bacterium]